MEWLIVGGGIHGSIIAGALLSHTSLSASELRLMDPHPEPLSAWTRRVKNCGMQFLRSPAAHAIPPDFTNLMGWAAAHGFSADDSYRPPYARPSVSLFQAHAAATVRSSGIERCWKEGLVTSLHADGRHWIAGTADGTEVVARRILLATGRSADSGEPSLNRPLWANSPRVQHILDSEFDAKRLLETDSPVVVGGGATAVHFAAHLARLGKMVRLITRHEIDVHQFDSEPCFIGPRCYEEFLKTKEPDLRRQMIDASRHPGSVPPDLADELEELREAGRITVTVDDIRALTENEKGGELNGSRGAYAATEIALGTGFTNETPAPALLRQIERSVGALPRDERGCPVPDASLQWTPGIFLTGTLAEQELGPTAPNIIGAHNAAKRIVGFVNGKPIRVPRGWASYQRA